MNKLVSEIEMTTIRRLVFIYNKSTKILGHQNRARTGRRYQSVYDGASRADLGVVPRRPQPPLSPLSELS